MNIFKDRHIKLIKKTWFLVIGLLLALAVSYSADYGEAYAGEGDANRNGSGEILFNDQWLTDSPYAFNSYLAEFCGNCSEKIEEGPSSIRGYLSENGFSNCCLLNSGAKEFMDDPEDYYGLSGVCGIAHKNVTINGEPTTILLITCRGTKSFAEGVGDYFQGVKDGPGNIDEKVYVNVYDFEEIAYETIKMYGEKVYSDDSSSKLLKNDTSRKLKIVISGHSLGGAAANLLSARLNLEAGNSGTWFNKVNRRDIYSYTYGAIHVLTDSKYDDKGKEDGYENIHNIYNYKDTFGPYGSLQHLNVGAVYRKFGHTETFTIDKHDTGIETPSHNMSTYLEAIKAYQKYEEAGNEQADPPNEFKLSCFASRIGDGEDRYDVQNQKVALTLDVSGSMSDDIRKMKMAAENFGYIVFEGNRTLNNNVGLGTIEYSDSARTTCGFTTTEEEFYSSIDSLKSGGGTNIEAGLSAAYANLKNSDTDKPIILLMSDGEPTVGLKGDELVAYAQTIKDSGVTIYTLGFFGSSGKSTAYNLMERISSGSAYHYEAYDTTDLSNFFSEMADMLSGQRYIYTTVKGDVDVSVSYDGETLSSENGKSAERTSFGSFMLSDVAGSASSTRSGSTKSSSSNVKSAAVSLGNHVSNYSCSDAVNPMRSLELISGSTVAGASWSLQSVNSGSSDSDKAVSGNVKVMRLRQGPSYDLTITSKADSDMNCTIELMDDQGDYNDSRVFENIPIASGATAHLIVDAGSTSRMCIYDAGSDLPSTVYEASSNGKAELVDYTEASWRVFAAVCAVFIVVLVALSALCVWRVVAKRKRIRAVSMNDVHAV